MATFLKRCALRTTTTCGHPCRASQSRLGRNRTRATRAANQIHFVFDGGSNLDPKKDKHMHEGTLTFIDDDHIEFVGVCWDGGKPDKAHECAMKLARKK